MSNRTITAHHRKVAARLKAIYTQKRKDLGLTQIKIAEALGINQAAVSQYFNGTIATNFEIIVRFASILQVDPADIDDELLRTVAFTLPSPSLIPVRYALVGQPSITQMELTIVRTTSEECYAVEVNTNAFFPAFVKGSYAVVDPTLEPEAGDMVFVLTASDARFFAQLKQADEHTITMDNLQAGDPPVVIAREDIVCCDLIVGIEVNRTQRKRR